MSRVIWWLEGHGEPLKGCTARLDTDVLPINAAVRALERAGLTVLSTHSLSTVHCPPGHCGKCRRRRYRVRIRVEGSEGSLMLTVMYQLGEGAQACAN